MNVLHVSSAGAVGRILLAFALTYAVGFERELRGSPAGDRTFSLIGVGSAIIGLLALANAPQALAGVITGVGFIGAGLVWRPKSPGGRREVQGITTAATIFATAGIGAAAGQGAYAVAVISAALVLFTLEIRNLPGLRVLDARRWAGRFAQDEEPEPSLGPDPGD